MAAQRSAPLRFGRRTMMDGIYILYMVFGEMLYGCGVVGGVLHKIVVKYGARTSLFLTSQRMPGATTRTHAYIILKTE